MLTNNYLMELMKQPVRTVEGRIEYHRDGGSSSTAIRHDSDLKSFTVERIGEEGKFFGFGICHKANVKIRDVNRKYSFTTADVMRPTYIEKRGATNVLIDTYPKLHISECHRDELTNELSITLYDKLYQASQHTVSELGLPENYTVAEFVTKVSNFIGANGYRTVGTDMSALFYRSYEGGANFDGAESIRDALNAVAEITQSIYYINHLEQIVFKRLDVNGAAALTIEKADYINLDSKTNRKLTTIVHATELDEDGIPKTTGEIGTTQYVRNNPFWEKHDTEDIEDIVQDAIDAIGGLTINQFNCNWRGNVLLEVGDKIALVTKDDNTVTSYVLNDVVTYDGTLSEETQWSYGSNEAETETKPVTLGEAIKKTYAKVDRINQTIDLVVKTADDDREANKDAMASININLESITQTVGGLVDNTNSSVEGINEEIAKLYSEVQTKMTKEAFEIAVNKKLEEDGTTKVVTSKGFRFDDDGLTVSKANSGLETVISENGMVVKKDGEDMLTANEDGVNAKNLHATTYLIIGTNSRFEDYDGNRTGCFWVGG